MKLFKIMGIFSLCILASSCDPQSEKTVKHPPLAFETSDECHVCGMLITQFKGPKGQAFDNRNKQVKKFCSTTELLYWYLQPENTHNVSELYVHDMANTQWQTPDDAHLISARDAFYVINSSMQGSMGKALASFLSARDAAKFADLYGGQVISFNGLTLTSMAAQ